MTQDLFQGINFNLGNSRNENLSEQWTQLAVKKWPGGKIGDIPRAAGAAGRRRAVDAATI